MIRSSIGAVLLGAVLAIGPAACAENGQGPARGSKAPEIKAKKWFNAKGEPSLEKLRGKIVVVEFWATWCPPCRTSIPHLNALHEKFKDKGVVILGLSNEPPEKVEKFIRSMNRGEKKQMTYIVAAGSDDFAKYSVRGIPHAFVLDTEGKVLWSGHPMGGLDAAVEKAVKDFQPAEKKPGVVEK